MLIQVKDSIVPIDASAWSVSIAEEPNTPQSCKRRKVFSCSHWRISLRPLHLRGENGVPGWTQTM